MLASASGIFIIMAIGFLLLFILILTVASSINISDKDDDKSLTESLIDEYIEKIEKENNANKKKKVSN